MNLISISSLDLSFCKPSQQPQYFHFFPYSVPVPWPNNTIRWVYLHITEYKELFWVLISLEISAIFYLVESSLPVVTFFTSGHLWYCTLPTFLQLGSFFAVLFASSASSSQPLNPRVPPLTLSGPFLISLYVLFLVSILLTSMCAGLPNLYLELKLL